MNIIQLPLGEVHPYKNNPRKNDGAVDAVAESIHQRGKTLLSNSIGA